MTNKNKGRIVSEKRSQAAPPARLHWLVGLSALPLLGVVGAFGIAPQTSTETVIPRPVMVTVGLTPTTLQDDGKPMRFWREEQVQRGDTIGSLLARLRVDDAEALAEITRVRNGNALRQMIPGRIVKAVSDEDGRLLELQYRGDSTWFDLARSADGFQVGEIPPVMERRTVMKSAIVQSSLFAATDSAGIPDAIAIQLAEVFSSDVDFHRDLRKGDRFAVVYEMQNINGEPDRAGRILAAEFVNQGQILQAVYFEDAKGRGGYYAPDGRNMRKAFLRSPLEFSRITSGFSSSRFHPVLKTWRAHKGIDYGAPTGTRVRATADGVVVSIGVHGGYGNAIVLKHANGYSTLYGHLSGFAQGIRAGTRVEQGDLIGFVGMTGLATGPHLHYEFHVNGVHVDPLRRAPQPGPAITAHLRSTFNAYAHEQLAALELLRETNLAALE